MLQCLTMSTAIKVILTEDSNAGQAGELVKVKLGYARNYLLPRGLAVMADVINIQKYEEQKAEIEKQAEDKRKKAEAIKDKLSDDAQITIKTKSGESGKLFGAITKEKIVEAIKRQLKIDVTKDNVKLSSPIKTIGEFSVKLDLGCKVETEISVRVVAEN